MAVSRGTEVQATYSMSLHFLSPHRAVVRQQGIVGILKGHSCSLIHSQCLLKMKGFSSVRTAACYDLCLNYS